MPRFGARTLATCALLPLAIACDGGGGSPIVHPPQCPELEPIECATDIGGGAPFFMSGSTEGAEDGFGGASCGRGGDAVEDAAFRWTAPRADTYEFSTRGSDFDTVLYVRSGSCVGRELACNDDLESGVVVQSGVRLPLMECQTVTVVIDGPSIDSRGGFELAITGTEASCDDGVDDDGDGLTDCDDDDCFTRECSMTMGTWPPDWETGEWTMLDLVNQRRAEGAVCGGVEMPPVPPLEMDDAARLAARRHSQDMADNGYFSHDGLDGSSVDTRMRAAGFSGAGPLGENIARNIGSPEAAVDGFMGSPGHCTNIMTAAFHVMGVGFYTNGTADGTRWTQTFGGSH